MSSSVHANNKSRSILVLGKDIRQGIDNTTIYGENIYSDGDNSYLKTSFIDARIKLGFKGDPLKQDKVRYNHGPIVNIYIVYR